MLTWNPRTSDATCHAVLQQNFMEHHADDIVLGGINQFDLILCEWSGLTRAILVCTRFV